MDLAEILRTTSDKKIEIGKARGAIVYFGTPGFRDKVDQWERDELFEFL